MLFSVNKDKVIPFTQICESAAVRLQTHKCDCVMMRMHVFSIKTFLVLMNNHVDVALELELI